MAATDGASALSVSVEKYVTEIAAVGVKTSMIMITTTIMIIATRRKKNVTKIVESVAALSLKLSATTNKYVREAVL
ncbi:hypothetical protein JCM19039_4363 [Geomicrobium sp. JCM 19039]|nr:hypothetical protein JCM19039_4363 [Geomicrobium sp. JCM 19039]